MQIVKNGNYTIYISEKSDGNARNFDNFLVCNQVHGNEVFLLESNNKNNSLKNINSDGIITHLLHTKIGVLTADCNGIILMGKQFFGVVHAGRRGLKNKVIENGIKILQNKGEKKSEIKFFVGPSIRKCCYEIGNEFLDYFDKKYFHKNGKKYHFDMIEFLYDELINFGIQKENIIIHPSCTKCSPDFFSYRDHNLEERIVIGIEKFVS